MADDVAQRTCTLDYVRTALGRRDYGADRIASYVTLLIYSHGFPPPLPVLRRRRGIARPFLDATVSAASRWHRAAVDQWLDDFLPPDNHAALDRAALRAAAATMDGNAGRLQLVQGGRR